MRHLCAKILRKLIKTVIPNYKTPFIDISDKFVNQLYSSNAGMLHRRNLYCFDYAIGNLPSDAPIVEIGPFCGLSTNLLTYYKKRHNVGNRLITCDDWKFEVDEEELRIGVLSLGLSEFRAFVKDSFIRNIRMFSRYDLPYMVNMSSDEFFTGWRKSEKVNDVLGRSIQLGGSISFCFIDGNHSYEFVKRDFENCHEFLEKGGFILFDDSADGSGWEVCKVVEEIKRSGKYRLITKNPNYLFRKR